MKKLFLLAAVAIMTATSANAQSNGYDSKHEVALSLGLYSNSQWLDVLENVTLIVASGAKASFDNDRFMGPISAEYFYRLKPWIGVGGLFVYGNNKQDLKLDGVKDGEVKHAYYTLMPAVKFDWLRKQHFGMYSKLAVGMTLRKESIDSEDDVRSEDETMTHVNWQLSFLGIEAGGPTIRGFLELGTGEQGIILAGIRYKF